MSLYLLLNILTISAPLVLTFVPGLSFYKKVKYVIPGLIITAAFFIVWDVFFTEWGIWGFNPEYLIGIDILNLPLEEWLFFITVPYACIFIYASLEYHLKKDFFKDVYENITLLGAVALIGLAIIFSDRLYTVVTFNLTAFLLVLHRYVFKKSYLSRFYFAFIVMSVPFLIVNGILTGSFIEQEVVWYNHAENMGLRINTIPVEDGVYAFLLILMNVSFYEWLKEKRWY
jgi:lycopene cyclase domain-containing protein